MEKHLEELMRHIRTKEELIFLLEEIAQKKFKEEGAAELEKKLYALPEIKLEIAFSPDDNFLERIGQWLEKELGQKIILNLAVNPKIVAGAIIEYRGRWRDFSLAKEIDKFYELRIKPNYE